MTPDALDEARAMTPAALDRAPATPDALDEARAMTVENCLR